MSTTLTEFQQIDICCYCSTTIAILCLHSLSCDQSCLINIVGPYCNTQEVSCDCNSPCASGQVCSMANGAPVCGCPDCMTGDYCDVKVDSCYCNNPCNNKDTCQDIGGSAQCVCDCTGNEECRTDPASNQQVCKCPVCFFNAPGQAGCMSRKLKKLHCFKIHRCV